MFEVPTKSDLDRNLSTILHDAHQKARAEKMRLTSEFAARGMVSSTALIGAVVGVLDGIHKDALERANLTLFDFAERMQALPSEISAIARPHLQNMGDSVLGELPPAGFPKEHLAIRNRYSLVFKQRLDGVLRDLEIGIVGGRNVARASMTAIPANWSGLSQMADPEIRGRLLTVFYERRHNAEGWVPTSDIDLSPHSVDRQVLGGVCQQLADLGFIEWKPLRGASEGLIIGRAKITVKGVATVEAGGSAELDIRFSTNPYRPISPTPSLEGPMSDAALAEIREAVNAIKRDIAALTLSNTTKADIDADIAQIEIETDRPTPRPKFLKTFLESLQDNLAKVMATGVAGAIGAIGAIIAKYFHVF